VVLAEYGGEVADAARTRESPVYRRIVNDVRDRGLNTDEIAAITGVTERQVQNWVAGSSRPTGTKRDLLLELHYVTDLLSEVYTPEGVEVWIHGRNRFLSGERPIDLLRAGSFEPVLNEVERLARGGGA
jgi:transcriptional regulator with XRE-family HTH domain